MTLRFIIGLDYLLRTYIDKTKENGTLHKQLPTPTTSMTLRFL